ncbi:DUF3095 domain-containing protein [Sulfitobacter aestuariivivens]|uniref:DUF3095 domain-containing protein n=1 Tax=Sulfitobacter aestuariivivens TaxID=2766981 RepID=UPI001FE7208E|nr:DUF3095 domain-containing protein [Sulfitobacter aestuariivivens]
MGEVPLTTESSDFYTNLPLYPDFAQLARDDYYTALPDDWWVGTSDILGSTKLVAEGRYKTVNMVGAAVISAQINAHGGTAFPFVFGGDGASFAVPPVWHDAAADALAAVRLWAHEAFGVSLRVGLVQMRDLRAAGHDVKVARFHAANAVDYAMFAGGGLSWAETQMKAGAHDLPKAPPGSEPDLTGLSCRWGHMQSRHGTVLSVVIVPQERTTPAEFSDLAEHVLELVSKLDRGGHPTSADGPAVKWPPTGSLLEAHARRGKGSLRRARIAALFESSMYWFLYKTGIKLAGFDAHHFRAVVGGNADFRKFDDGLKMTLDCDAQTEASLRALLQEAEENGTIRYGLHAQSEAMMTCIVPSSLSDDHMHFVDGAAGGYTSAAQAIKAPG